MKLYVDIAECAAVNPASLCAVLAYHWDGVSQGEREAGLGRPSSPFELVHDPDAADIFVLPREWNHYLWHGKQAEALALADRARSHGKRLLVWFRGDGSPIVDIENSVVFKSGLHRSRRTENEQAIPFFINDPARRDERGELVVRAKGVRPVVGFCGYAAVNPIKIGFGIATNALEHLRHLVGSAKYAPEPLVPATVLRAKALDRLERDDRVDANFLIRDKYQAGFRRKDTSAPARAAAEEFFDNVTGSDYTLCIRGNGNWSIRLYETLASGRIPIFVDTDCVLPFDTAVDWQRYVVWVDGRDVGRIGERVAEFHARLSADEFVELQRACRRLWEERLSLDGFMSHVPELFLAAPKATGVAAIAPSR